MSIWTHVAGVIRFDGIPGVTPPPDCGIFAPSWAVFSDEGEDEALWESCNVPMGSEGSLGISTWTDPTGHSTARDVVTIFGDLRDYDDEQEIIDYFNRIVEGADVRQACFSFYVGAGTQRTFVYDHESQTFKEAKI